MRSFSGKSDSSNQKVLQAYRSGSWQPQVAPFQLSLEQAKDEFLAWQRRQLFLAPNDLLRQGTYEMKPKCLPFWLFTATAKVEYCGAVGRRDRGGGIDWRQVGWQVLPPQKYNWRDPDMQVYASYKHRRDFAEVAKANGKLGDMLVHLPQEAEIEGVYPGFGVSSNEVPGVPLDAPSMRQSIAWEFALRAMHLKEVHNAEHRLKQDHDAQLVRDLHVRITPLSRQAGLAFAPVYVLNYIYGETFNVHGERKDEEFQALVSGAVVGLVAGERHISAHKVSLVAGSAAASLMGLSSLAAPLLGVDPWSLLSMEGAVYTFVTAWAAGLSARLVPGLIQQRAEEIRVQAEEIEFARVVSMGMGPTDPGSQEQEVLRSNAEWRRWEESDKSDWQEGKRQRWAEQLWRGQHKRRLDRLRMSEHLRKEAARLEAEDERERRRRKRWGSSSQQHHFREGWHIFSGGTTAGGRWDFLGYYRLLGLEGRPQGSISQEEIKHAFRRAALQWHPDKFLRGGKDAQTQLQARQRFNEIRAAYDVLKNPELRKKYDNGQNVQP